MYTQLTSLEVDLDLSNILEFCITVDLGLYLYN